MQNKIHQRLERFSVTPTRCPQIKINGEQCKSLLYYGEPVCNSHKNFSMEASKERKRLSYNAAMRRYYARHKHKRTRSEAVTEYWKDPAARKRQSEIMKGRKNPMYGKKNSMYGKKHSPEALAKMRAAQQRRRRRERTALSQ